MLNEFPLILGAYPLTQSFYDGASFVASRRFEEPSKIRKQTQCKAPSHTAPGPMGGSNSKTRRSQSAKSKKQKIQSCTRRRKVNNARPRSQVPSDSIASYMTKDVYEAYVEATTQLDSVQFRRFNLMDPIPHVRPVSAAPVFQSSPAVPSKPLPRVKRLTSVNESTGESVVFTWIPNAIKSSSSSSTSSTLPSTPRSNLGLGDRDKCRTLAREFQEKMNRERNPSPQLFSRCASSENAMMY